jgi:hypothetical protein
MCFFNKLFGNKKKDKNKENKEVAIPESVAINTKDNIILEMKEEVKPDNDCKIEEVTEETISGLKTPDNILKEDIKSGTSSEKSSNNLNTKFFSLYGNAHGPKYKNMNPPKPWQDYLIQGDIILNDIVWNIAIVADGAGSSEHSEKASKFCCNKLYEIASEYIVSHKWLTKDNLPSEEEWELSASYFFDQTRQELLAYAATNNLPEGSFNCTLILVIRTAKGFLSANIGDGRAGYVSKENSFPLIIPFQTFNVGATKFLASSDWNHFFRTYFTPVDLSQLDYYVVSSDGCTYFWDTEGIPRKDMKGIYDNAHPDAFYDKNLIDHAKLNPVVEYLSQKAENAYDDTIKELKHFLNSGELNGEKTDFADWISKSLDGSDDKAILIFVKKS